MGEFKKRKRNNFKRNKKSEYQDHEQIVACQKPSERNTETLSLLDLLQVC